MSEHVYELSVQWTGNTGTGTTTYQGYRRDHVIIASGCPPLLASADPAFRGDATRYNPEELLVASLAACHMLWFLHLCADHNVNVTNYQDVAKGVMVTDSKGMGRFARVILRPKVTVATPEMAERTEALHDQAHRACFIANSVAFPVEHEATVDVQSSVERRRHET